MRWPFVTSRTHRREQQRCADAINSTIYWRQNSDDLRVVSYARGLALETIIRHWPTHLDELRVLADEMEREQAGGPPKEVREIAASEVRRMIGCRG